MKHKTLLASEIREADRRCIEELGIPGAVLMNNAGCAVFHEITQGPVGIVCGKGNNGGDGFVVARLALLAGLMPRVLLVADPDEIQGDAAQYMHVYRKLGGAMCATKDPVKVSKMVHSLSDCVVLVDALLGTGISGEVRGAIRAAIEAWPRGVRTIAVDLPSGLNADTGTPCGCSIRADITVTFQYSKKGFENPIAMPYTGRVVVADIGIPAVCADKVAWKNLLDRTLTPEE